MRRMPPLPRHTPRTIPTSRLTPLHLPRHRRIRMGPIRTHRRTSILRYLSLLLRHLSRPNPLPLHLRYLSASIVRRRRTRMTRPYPLPRSSIPPFPRVQSTTLRLLCLRLLGRRCHLRRSLPRRKDLGERLTRIISHLHVGTVTRPHYMPLRITRLQVRTLHLP